MAKKSDIRIITASEDLAGLVDHGSDVDTQINNLTYESKGIKSKLADEAALAKEDSEVSVKFQGKIATALVSSVEKVEIDVNAESYPECKGHIDSGLLSGVVEKKLKLVVPPEQVAAAMAILSASGLKVSLVEELSTTAKKVRDAFSNTPESLVHASALESLKNCIKRSVNWRVEYERN